MDRHRVGHVLVANTVTGLQRWDRMDTNGDGIVDKAEQAVIFERICRMSGRFFRPE
jgi:hypothetical protein